MPPARRFGRNAKVWIQREVRGSTERIELSTPLRGFTGLQGLGNIEEQVEVVGSGGVRGSARTGYRSVNFSFGCDANSEVDQVLFACAGARVTVEVAPTGLTTTGQPKREIDAVVSSYTHTAQDRRKETYAIRCLGEEALEIGTYA